MPIRFLQQIIADQKDQCSRISPAADILSVIEGFYRFDAEDIAGKKQLLFNNGFPSMIIMPRQNDYGSVTANDKTFSTESVWVSGGIMKKIYWQSPAAKGSVLVVRFYPAAFFRIFQLSNDHFQHTPVINFSTIVHSLYPDFVHDYYALQHIHEKIDLITSLVSPFAIPENTPALLTQALQYITLKRGKVPVKTLLHTSGVSVNYKWWERNFKRYLGLSPQRYILAQRFLHTYADLYREPAAELMDIALNNGYYDGNHLVKDFLQYTGIPPKAYFREQ